VSAFLDRLRDRQPDPAGRRWVYVPYDQLNHGLGPLADTDPAEIGIVLVESGWKAARRAVHRQKLYLVLANQRQFALEQAARGVAVDYRFSDRSYAEVLAEVVSDRGPLTVMRPAERELRSNLAPLVADGRLVEVPHTGWLTAADDFRAAGETPPWRMDAFYRHVRRRTGVLMEGGKPVGGRYSFDGDNRERWRGDPPAPTVPRFTPDAVSLEVADLVATRFASHPGRLDPAATPTTATDAEALWGWATRSCMPHFGPYEDALSTRSRSLFHTRISPLLNNGRLLPQRVVDDVVALDVPINSVEGFVRQVLGWREFVRHVHEATDGFRAPGTQPGFLAANTPLPPAYWGTESGLRCLDDTVQAVWEDGASHHITRLMVLSNLGMLLDVDPRALTDWFWVAYTDAYDWVVEPNVLGMGTFAVGELMTTKPYVAGSGYIHRMGDHCASCAFHPKKTCPLTPMYWAYLERHREALAGVQRIRRQLWSVERRSDSQKADDRRVFEVVRERLAVGQSLTPETLGRAT
jgi:deoxyribodipyrimidine photolyase-related protein